MSARLFFCVKNLMELFDVDVPSVYLHFISLPFALGFAQSRSVTISVFIPKNPKNVAKM